MHGADQIAILLRCMYGVDRITIHVQLKSQKNFAKSLKSSALPKFIIDVAPINVKFGTGERTFGPLPQCPLPRAEFHVYYGKSVGIQLPKLSKFRILVINLPPRGHSFAQFLPNSQILYASPGGF